MDFEDARTSNSREYAKQVRAYCSGCPVQAECLETALAINEQWGFWGGLSPAARRKLPRRLRAVS